MAGWRVPLSRWYQTWSDEPIGWSLQSFLTNMTPTLSGTDPPATFDKYELIPHILQNIKYE